MTTSRKSQIDINESPFVHVCMRTVRRAFLFGDDPTSGKNYDHRKQWIVTRMRQLASVFAIDICAYAVMSNHYHAVLHVDLKQSNQWTDQEVAQRWKQLFKGHLLVDRWLEDSSVSLDEQSTIKTMIDEWRARLADISWFMRCLNESIARQSNKEDDCKGRFWEGRFKSQALLDEAAILTCMTYVDLNPIRAKMAELPETSDFTSIQSRLYEKAKSNGINAPIEQQLKERIETQTKLEKQLLSQLDQEDPSIQSRLYEKVKSNEISIPIKQHLKERIETQTKQEKQLLSQLDQEDQSIHLNNLHKAPLFPFACSASPDQHSIPFGLEDYIELVDTTGRIIREGKRGFIDDEAPPILSRLGIDDTKWIRSVKKYGTLFGFAAGKATLVRKYAAKLEHSSSRGVGKTPQELYRPTSA